MTISRLAALAFALNLIAAVTYADDRAQFFESRIRPVLVQKCGECHGEKGAKGGLKLNSREAILKGGDSGPAALPGKPDESPLIAAVRYIDEPKMPPKGKLSESEIRDLTKWVADGLAWPEESGKKTAGTNPISKPGRTVASKDHWSLRPVKVVGPPAVQDAEWPLTNIDRYLLARLEAEGLKPAPPADKRTLLRRVTFDLTGLPPTVEETDAFLADASPDAYAKAVDRLLASPRYGERWGRHWLDVVRYADSRDARGIGGDTDIAEAYRYRDWVVNALNRDMPYDQFIVRQIAGDLLPPDSPGGVNVDGMVATGLLTIGEWGTGDADKEKMLTDVVADQIDVVSRAFMGLTIACARCHDHKFDPITQRDYYGLAGIFFSTRILPEPGIKTGGSPLLRTPIVPASVVAAGEKYRKDLVELDVRLKSETASAFDQFARQQLPRTADYLEAAWRLAQTNEPNEANLDAEANRRGLSAGLLRQWVGRLGSGPPGGLLSIPETNYGGKAGLVAWKAPGDLPSAAANLTDKDETYLTFKLPAKAVSVHPSPDRAVAIDWASPVGGGIRIDARIIDSDPAGGDGIRWSIEHRQGRARRTLAGEALANGTSKNVSIGQSKPILVRPGDTIRLLIHPGAEHTCDTTTVRLAIRTADGSKAWDLAADTLPRFLDPNRPGPWRFASVPTNRLSEPAGTLVFDAWNDAILDAASGAVPGEPLAVARAALQTALKAADAKSPLLAETLALLRPRSEGELPRQVRAHLATVRTTLEKLRANPPPPIPVALVAQDGGVPKSEYEGIHDVPIHIRGDYRRRGPIVPRGVPAVIAGNSPFQVERGSGRLELARWIARADHPLTARVMVNRIWQGHFGLGLVKTPGNFGTLGEPPSHPELLDDLADRFIRSGWSMKTMHRMILLSRAYQQSAIGWPATVRLDPENRLVGRMSRRRLEAEALRDAMLAVSGKLDPALGGPAVTSLASPRRTLYLMTIRSDRSSFGPLFDAADPAALIDQRSQSIVAPQALFLLNDPTAIAWTRDLADAVLARPGLDDRGRIAWLHRRLYARPPTREEEALGLRMIAESGSWFEYAQVLVCANEFLFVD